ncbi:MAG: DUF1140 domain-containing protein [Virgibacillus proomii]|jgi:hypothetical protein
MNDVTLKFANQEEYKKFIQNIKNDVIQELKPEPTYNPSWPAIRDSIESRFRNGYGEGCGHHYTNQQSLYAVFRLAFQQPTIKDLKNVDGERIKALHDDLFNLIDKYREGNK